MSRLLVLAALLNGVAASVSTHLVFAPDATNCDGRPSRIQWSVSMSKEPWAPGNCQNVKKGICEIGPQFITNFGGNAITQKCVDPTGASLDDLPKEVPAFFPEAAKDQTYFVSTTYENTIGAESCKYIEGLDELWQRTAYLADGECRDYGTGTGPNGKQSKRFMRFSCQIDGSAYVKDWCEDSTCGSCQFASVAGFKECGQMGGPFDIGGNSIIGGYCMKGTDAIKIPGEKPGKGYQPPPPTGPESDQIVKNAAAKLALGSSVTGITAASALLMVAISWI
ncbi:hypothetical protein DFJ77DRAFT_448796 [Powellomyces hirtus]|nr:hypothetical protein DFJ77DRAFT_448796 [Powellomyces hirtus]